MHVIVFFSFADLLFLIWTFSILTETMMANNNITEFILLGLTQDPRRQKIIFVIFFVFYVGKLVGNLLIFVTIKFSWTLGSPMYFFIFHLSVSDTCFSTSIAPRLIVDALASKKKNKNKNISYNECMTQVFALHIHGCMEIFVLILMAVDHYVAICKPLHYPTIMRHQACILLIVFAWIGSFIHSMAQIILALRLPSCGPNLIDHYCCELQPCWNLPACTLMQSACCWCLTVGPYAQAALWFWWSHTLLSCIPWETTVHKERKKFSPLSLRISLFSSYSLAHVYLYTHAPNHLPHGQDGGCVLYYWNTLSQSTHLHIEECISEICHEKVMVCQNYFRKQKMNWGVSLITYWMMVWLT